MVLPAIGLFGEDDGKLVWAVSFDGTNEIHIWREGELQTYCESKPKIVIASTKEPTCKICKEKFIGVA